jgi:2-succinyl-6-hydroxy-2,4-cyclohexadiene-1-carboxylate synthase
MTTPLVLFHGFTGAPGSFDAVIARLPDRRTLCPALIGHGASAPGVASFVDEVDRLASLMPTEPAHLAGYSLGARLALGLTLRHPQRVARLTLVGVNPGLTDEAERLARRRADAALCELLETQGLDAFLRVWEGQPLFASQERLEPAVRARRLALRRGHQPDELARCLRITGLSQMPDYWPELPRLTPPLTLLAGELDAKFCAMARAAQAQVPGSRLVIAPGAGHDLLLERPDLVAVELSRDQHDPTAA